MLDGILLWMRKLFQRGKDISQGRRVRGRVGTKGSIPNPALPLPYYPQAHSNSKLVGCALRGGRGMISKLFFSLLGEELFLWTAP